MKKETFTFNDAEGIEIFVYKWIPDGEIKGIFQIVHGMAETAERYEWVAEELIKNGYAVYVNDQRGHGKTAGTIENLGYCGENGFEKMTQNTFEITQNIRNDYPSSPIFLLGHNMGSFVVQNYVENFPLVNIKGVLLSGSNGKMNTFLLTIIEKLAKSEIKRNSPKEKNELLHSLLFGTYNAHFKPAKTNFDWLTRDEEEVRKYIENPFCGAIHSSGFYFDMTRLLKKIYKKRELKKIPKNIPIYIFSGEKDPVGLNGKGITKLYQMYKDLKMNDVSFKLYPEGRHEMLNEINKKEVIDDIFNWVEKR